MGEMTAPVKRSYDNDGRRAQSAQTRLRILEIARQSFTTKGYRATKMAEITRSAGVHIDTVYALVGRKPDILRELIELAISGGDQPLAADDRDYVQRMKAEPDPAKKLAIYAGAMSAIQARMAPLLLALRDASTTDDAAAQVWGQISDRRAANMRRLVADLGEASLRDGVNIDEAADMVWAIASSDLYVLLTGERGWTPDRYEVWLYDTLCRVVLGHG